MRRLLILAVFAACTAAAQSVVDPARFSPKMLDFESHPEDKPLECELTQVKPALNFSFRFQAGYVVMVPMRQYTGRGHFWGTIARVTSEDGKEKPVYLGTRMRLPEIPPNKTEIEFAGGFLLGEGRYHVSWKLFDDSGRVCLKNWNIDAKLHHSEHKVKVALPPGTISDYSLRGVSLPKRNDDDDVPHIRLTVLMHAAPSFARRTRIGPRDRLMLLGTLSSLLERLPVRSVRLVVFNLDQQKELFRQENFSPRAMDQVSQSINAVELGKVDVQVLQNRGGHVNLLADLIQGELNSETPSDVVLFMGPLSRFSDKMPSYELVKPAGAATRFYYLQYRPNFPQPSALPDLISNAVGKLKGKTLVIHSPGDFAKAIEQVGHR